VLLRRALPGIAGATGSAPRLMRMKGRWMQVSDPEQAPAHRSLSSLTSWTRGPTAVGGEGVRDLEEEFEKAREVLRGRLRDCKALVQMTTSMVQFQSAHARNLQKVREHPW
jgi:hypothetical protein